MHRVIFNGKKATAVSYEQGGRIKQAKAAKEVILCAGAIGSPQILMLSGVGPAGVLAERGIEVIADLPGVGRNLQDHLMAPVVWGTRN